MDELNLPKKRIFQNKASIFKRIAAFFADMFIVQLIIIKPFSGILQNIVPSSAKFVENYNYFAENSSTLSDIYGVFFAIFGLSFIYFVVFQHKLKQTPGMMILNIYVAHAEKKKELSLLQIIGRNLAILPIMPFSLLWIIDPLYIIFTGNRLSDNLCKTQIIEEMSL